MVDLHPWHSRIDAPDRPDWAVFDLDPFEPASFDDVRDIARLVKAALDHLGLRGLLKTSGQTGLQIYVPLRRGPDYGEVRGWVEEVARAIGRVEPDRITWEWAVSRRAGRIRIDYTQNIINKTLAAPYSLRPLPGATVSTPLAWEELDEPGLRPDGWNMATIWGRPGRGRRPLRRGPDRRSGAAGGQGCRAGSGERGRRRPVRTRAGHRISGMAVLLLNASLQPLNVISHRRLVVLLSKERVAFLDTDAEVRAVAALQDRRIPEDVVIVRLLRNIHVPRRVLRPNRRNLLLRDDNTCQYCGIVTVPAELTVDHVIPVSRGGAPDSWDNVVLACKRCNWRKADRLPAEVGMHLLRAPHPLTQEYAHIIFLRYPALKAAYDAFCASAAA